MAESTENRLLLRIDIPGEHVRVLSDGKSIEKELLQILSFCSGRKLITVDPESELKYDELSVPLERTERYGNREYGLCLRAQPIQSGVGVHGEVGQWEFSGLPEGIKISANSRLDMRGGVQNYYSLEISGDNSGIRECVQYVKKVFGSESRKLTE